MVLLSCIQPVPLDAMTEARAAAADALRAIGTLTRLAGSASTVADALRLHDIIQPVDAAATQASFTALGCADLRCGENR
jgi:hypothetical protein